MASSANWTGTKRMKKINNRVFVCIMQLKNANFSTITYLSGNTSVWMVTNKVCESCSWQVKCSSNHFGWFSVDFNFSEKILGNSSHECDWQARHWRTVPRGQRLTFKFLKTVTHCARVISWGAINLLNLQLVSM